MDLKEFVQEALQQIVEGVHAAQSGEGGQNVNASIPGMGPNGHLINGGSYGLFTRVDFDVAVLAETQIGGKGGLKVFSIGVEANGNDKHSTTSRISFSVPVRLPDGDQSRKEESRERSRQLAEDRREIVGRSIA